MHKSSPSWLVISVAQGIKLLLCARFSGAPFAGNEVDTQAVCEAWLVALMNKSIDWHESADKWRLETAFEQLLTNSRRWPVPAELFDYLPNRRETNQAKIGYRPELNSVSRVNGFRSLNEIRRMLSLPQIPNNSE